MPLSRLFRIGRLEPARHCGGFAPQVSILLRKFFISVRTRRGYSRAFSVSSALGVFQTPNRLFGFITQKKTPRVRDVFERSKVGGRREFFWKKNRLLGFFISVIKRRGYSRAFPASPALGVFLTPNRYLFSPPRRQDCNLALQCKSNRNRRSQTRKVRASSRTRPFWGRVCIDFAIEGRRGGK